MTNIFRLFLLAGLVLLFSACASTGNSNAESEVEAVSEVKIVRVNPVVTWLPDVADNKVLEVELNKVFYFEFDKSTLSPDVRSSLSAYAAVLKDRPRDIRLEGHGDERGTREYNIALGERRSNAIRDYFVGLGLDSRRIEVVSYGEERPADTSSNEQAWALNRRVELK